MARIPNLIAAVGFSLITLVNIFFRKRKVRNICIASSIESCDQWIEANRNHKVFGVDMEWNSNVKVCVVQIAASHGNVLLIQLMQLKEFPLSIKKMLEDSSVIKTGVGIQGDAIKIYRDYGVLMQSCVDLAKLAQRKGFQLKSYNLCSLVEYFLNYSIPKDKSLRCSDWSVVSLSPSQIEYAALDADVSRKLFCSIYSIATKNQQKDIFSSSCWTLLDSFCHEEFENAELIEKKANRLRQKERGNTSNTLASFLKLKRREQYKIMASQKSPMYDNCILEAPDGVVLALCKRKKIDWYVQRGIAELISEDPVRARLLFEPSGRSQEGDKYYTSEKKNVCVVCGTDSYLSRHYIVPYAYRQHFPIYLKSHSSHDIVLLCVDCNTQVAHYYQIHRKKLSLELNVHQAPPKFKVDPVAYDATKAASALLKYKEKLPLSRRKELLMKVRAFQSKNTSNSPDVLVNTHQDNFIQVDTLQNDLLQDDTVDISNIKEIELQQIAKADYLVPQKDYVENGKLIVDQIIYQGNLQTMEIDKAIEEFVYMWRSFFIEKMQPKNLPPGWSIEHRCFHNVTTK